jgi:hypothetical protein
MMKRPRSLIATLLVLLCLGIPLAGISATPTETLAGPAGSRLMNPRAGDPNEPDDGALSSGSGSGSYSPNDPTASIAPAPAVNAGATTFLQLEWQELFLLVFSLFQPGGR